MNYRVYVWDDGRVHYKDRYVDAGDAGGFRESDGLTTSVMAEQASIRYYEDDMMWPKHWEPVIVEFRQ
jgi:hypothetical protein